MTLPTMSPPAMPPARSSAPATYVQDMDTWLSYLADRINEFNAVVGAINTLPPEAYFPVMASLTDATAEKVMKVGAFGVGGIGASAHLTNYSDAGAICQILGDGATSTPPDKPASSRAHAGIHIPVAVNRWMQLLAEVAGPVADSGKLSFRRNYNGDISDWLEIFHQGSILGTVSQSGGVPTGALFERGSFASGEYLRIADGTQICWHRRLAGNSSGVTWTYPAPFVDADVAVQVTPTHSVAEAAMGISLFPAATSVDVAVFNDDGVQSSKDMNVTATGRWF